MNLPSCKWSGPSKLERGILCGAESSQEWLLPWWWSGYRAFHDLPVTFCDFGMSLEMRDWCAQRGEVISVTLDPSCVVQKESLSPSLIKHGESVYGERLWTSRQHWFKKPLALLRSPYKTALWLDIDCEILGSLTSLFSGFNPSSQLALVRESRYSHLPVGDPEILYNGGVIVFQHGSTLIQQWAQGSLEMNHLFLGDDHLLSHLIGLHPVDIQELPDLYNWRISQGLNLNAVIVHWVASGKEYIRKYGGLKPALEKFYSGLNQSNNQWSERK